MVDLGGVFLAWICLVVVVFVVAVARRARTHRERWTGWQRLAEERGLEAADGDPLGVEPWFGDGGDARVVRTLHGTVDGIPVGVVVVVRVLGQHRTVRSRSDVYGVADVGAPVPLERIRAELGHDPGVRVGALGDLAVVEPVRGLRLAVDHPPPEQAARLFDLAARAAGAARS